MKLSIRGKGDVKINGSDFVTSGGEAKIYRRNKMIYKIYHTSSEMIPDAKIYELQEIKERKVLIPKDVLIDSNGVRVGFTMDFIDNVTPLCKLFTNTFINENNVSNDTMIALVSRMQETIHQIHSANCIQVDGNELNYLVDENDFKTCYFIDTNSYQTKSFPATVIMPSIRDWTAKKFNNLTDWYSFAVIACQLFVGIHPFKGKHEDFKRHDMEKRMRAGISIFNKNTKVPKSVRDFERIPSNYMDWFIDLFENGKREVPPDRAGEANVKVRYILVMSTDNFVIEETFPHIKFDDTIIDHYSLDGNSITRTKKSIYINSDKHRVGRGVYLVHTPKSLTPVMVKLEDGQVIIRSCNKREVKMGSEITAEKIMVVDNTVYLKYGGTLIETRFFETVNNGPIMLLTKQVWQISEKSSQFFKNIIVQDLLGCKYMTIPLPHQTQSLFNVRFVVELRNQRVLDAKYENKVAVFSIFNHKTFEYKLLILKGIEGTKYSARYINTVDSNEVNFTTLDNGICILIYDDKMEIFSNMVDSTKVKLIKDKELMTMNLCKRGVATRFFTDNKIYSVGMKA